MWAMARRAVALSPRILAFSMMLRKSTGSEAMFSSSRATASASLPCALRKWALTNLLCVLLPLRAMDSSMASRASFTLPCFQYISAI